MRSIVLQEIRRRDDEPMSRIFELVRANFYRGSALSRPLLGSSESVQTLQRQDLRNFWKARYQPNNTLLPLPESSIGITSLSRCRPFLAVGLELQTLRRNSSHNQPRA